MTDIASNLQRVRDEINEAAVRAGREPDEITLLAVSKTFPVEAVRVAAEAGQRAFGENRVQEGASKVPLAGRDDLCWHLIGHLQSNKSRLAATHFDVIQTVDSLRLARRLSRHSVELGRMLEVFLQVNLGAEQQKSGLHPEQLSDVAAEVSRLDNLNLVGLMSIPPYHSEAEKSRPYFRRLRDLRDDVNGTCGPLLRELSMGMSGDFRVALEEGATVIRLGTAIFGPRP